MQKTETWVTDGVWQSGVAGAVMVLLLAALYKAAGVLSHGMHFCGISISPNDSLLVAVVLIALTMILVEMDRLRKIDSAPFFAIHPKIREKRYGAFLQEGVRNWLLHLLLFALVLLFYASAKEYGFVEKHNYYEPWFRFVTLAFQVYLFAGLPYVLFTRAVKYDPEADKREFSVLVSKILRFCLGHLPGLKKIRRPFEAMDAKIARAILVKVFFTPLMTVFFVHQFSSLVMNIHFLSLLIPKMINGGIYTHAQANLDIYNVAFSVIFSIDVGLAWCGYVVSSRWIKNQTISAEPTTLGWLVCLMCYPPFQVMLGWYYSAPAEHALLDFHHQWIVSFFVLTMLLSFIVYMLSTVFFGVRFSNLTHRGIIRKGPYAFVRHPAYASKNFSWWCLMFPVVIYQAITGNWFIACTQLLGLMFMTWLYYWRSITEERHLSFDPDYQQYCEQVRYRFIPGIL